MINYPDVKNSTKRDIFFVRIICCILKETLEQLSIIGVLAGCSAEDSAESLQYKTIEDRITELRNNYENKFYLRGKNKFKKDFAFIYNILNSTFAELKEVQSYEPILEDFLKIYETMRADEMKVIEDCKNKKIQLKKLKKLRDEDKQVYYSKIFDCMSAIGRIKDEIQDFELEAKIKFDYVKKWQNSKSEMGKILQSTAEENYKEIIKRKNHNLDKEARTHDEIEAAFNEAIEDDMNAIKNWKKKYEIDLSTRTQKIENLRDEYTDLLNKKKKLENLYLQHETEIIDYKEYKAKVLEEKILMERRMQAAIRIQAWWRGTMVLKGFGKYRKKKDKKPKKKSSPKEKTKTK